MLERDAVEKLHRDKALSVLVVNFVDRTYVGMIQRGSSLGFTVEAAEGLPALGTCSVWKELESQETAEFRRLRL